MSATRSPSGSRATDETEVTGAGTTAIEVPTAEPRRRRRRRLRLVPNALRKVLPKTLQARLTLGFAGVVALTLFLMTVFVLSRLDDEFRQQQIADLDARTDVVAHYVDLVARDVADGQAIVGPNNVTNPAVVAALRSRTYSEFIADYLAEADVYIVLGREPEETGDTAGIEAAVDGVFRIAVGAPNRPGLTQELLQGEPLTRQATESKSSYLIQVRLSNPYTFRQTAIENVATVSAAVGALAIGIAVLVAAAMALRVTTPLRRLTEASRALAEGQLGRRIPRADVRAGSSELAALAMQFNAMADQVEESVARIRLDRDRSRDFLADVSHELRTPIAALLTFNELLTERAGDDPKARAEFLESSRIQLERIDWLAQNLLELSKLESGLVLLDLRPDDLRTAVESAVEQARPAAHRRGVDLTLILPDVPIRIRHDPQRIGQVVTNLVGNGIKFTQPGGSVTVRVAGPAVAGATIEVRDTGVGIKAAELPRIFDRFYRGSLANEARGSGSGLGLAIVRSIVDMHRGTVEVASRPGAGTVFTVTLPADPRRDQPVEPTGHADETGDPASSAVSMASTEPAKMADSSPTGRPRLNGETSG